MKFSLLLIESFQPSVYFPPIAHLNLYVKFPHRFDLNLDFKTFTVEKADSALTSMAQLVGLRPAKRKVSGLTPGQGAGLGSGFGPHSAHTREGAD